MIIGHGSMRGSTRIPFAGMPLPTLLVARILGFHTSSNWRGNGPGMLTETNAKRKSVCLRQWKQTGHHLPKSEPRVAQAFCPWLTASTRHYAAREGRLHRRVSQRSIYDPSFSL